MLARLRDGTWVGSDYSHFYVMKGREILGVYDSRNFRPFVAAPGSDYARACLDTVRQALKTRSEEADDLTDEDSDFIERILRKHAMKYFGGISGRPTEPAPPLPERESPQAFARLIVT